MKPKKRAIGMRIGTLIFLVVFLWPSRICQAQDYFNNPVILGDMPDPSVVKIGDMFYATGTSSEWAPFLPIYSSADLVNWTHIGHVFQEKPQWVSHSFWAPEFFNHNEKLFCYYTARRKTDNVSYIGVASADSPHHEFTDHGPLIEYGSEAIDAFIFDDNGQLYISWKAYGLDNRPIELLCSKLSDDGLRLEGEVFSLLKDDEKVGMEGQYHFKHEDYYYIIYAARSCCGPSSDYEVRVARAKKFNGPYEKYAQNPILSGGDGAFLSGGHGTAVIGNDGRYFFLMHAYQKNAAFYLGRCPVLSEFYINADKWPQFTTGNRIEINQKAPFENTLQARQTEFYDDFDGNTLKTAWAWNYPFSDINARVNDGELTLSGNVLPENKYGTALCVRPFATDYSYETRLHVNKPIFSGLTMYGDDKNLVAFGVEGNTLRVVLVEDNHATVLQKIPFSDEVVYLKVDVKDGCFLTFYATSDGKNWTSLATTPIDAAKLVRWDRIARPGLLHNGQARFPSKFSYFRMTKTN